VKYAPETDRNPAPQSDNPAPARIVFHTDFSNRFTGGVREFEIAARNLRGVIKALEERYPGVGERIEKETIVAIDGEVYEIEYALPVRPGCEVYFIPKIEGG
jgi:molybdopterin synthase sulfur carrier subunit